MATRVSGYEGRALFDLTSYARRGPGRRDQLSIAEIQLIERTVARTPEVMVKVLNRGGQNLKAVHNHLAYLHRHGELDLETDDGQLVNGNGTEAALLKDWDLDIEADRRSSELKPTNHRQPPKLVHKLLFSMPPGTPPDKVLQAVQNFAREEFALKHRYAMVLHTDEPHPHVHLVVKAMSEQGVRLNIKKATLRHWRSEFARQLRELGVPANATERAVRGETHSHKLDGIYRAQQRGESTHLRTRAMKIADELLQGKIQVGKGRMQMITTRKAVMQGWYGVQDRLVSSGHIKLANQIDTFLATMKPPQTEQEQIARELLRLRGGRSERVR
ncbi:MAG: relaxase/mobilization nuclease domain-containing protein [Steroidobacteraceae bacterium]